MEVVNSLQITTLVMLEVDRANGELMRSHKGQANYKVAATLSTQTGNLPFESGKTALDADYEAVYWVVQSYPPAPVYIPIKIVNSFQSLEHARVNGRWAIMSMGLEHQTYQLSDVPVTPMNVEFWGKKVLIVATSLHDSLDIANVFTGIIVHRASLKALPQLLRPEVVKLGYDYTTFVLAQRNALLDEKKALTHAWDVYRTDAMTSQNIEQVDFYDPVQDLLSDYY